ncbi:hypothetical protein ONS95_009807 [Cadophora gregata]|nr:uncharacterized protein ONS95_009807 [Cadophora gregata]KAK0121515.1 hypothetical protein ONS95_009807 [Cadophora gregata]KAK0126991.1 hypothetical protein ONS96_006552 [Cadophora gregata f. sp. sojae]
MGISFQLTRFVHHHHQLALASRTYTKMAALRRSSLANVPEEILDQIIQSVPVEDLRNCMLTSRTFCRLARHRIYHSICYSVGRLPSERNDVASLRPHANNYNGRDSSRIIRLHDFVRTISENPILASFIHRAAFSPLGEHPERIEIKALKRCLAIVNPNVLHLALPYKSASLALMNSITSLDFTYPMETALSGFQHKLRNRLYSIFMIDSLRYLTLRCARCWQAFDPVDVDTFRIGTSNVVSLGLVDTVPMDVDLVEILTWPKALISYDHESLEGLDCFFQYWGRGPIASADSFLRGISSQKGSLEEIIYNHGEDCCGTDDSIFDPALLRQFSTLKHLSAPITCFVYSSPNLGMTQPLRTFLPSTIEALQIDQDNMIGEEEHEMFLRSWLQDVLDHKQECCPRLKTVVLSQSETMPGLRKTPLDGLTVLNSL